MKLPAIGLRVAVFAVAATLSGVAYAACQIPTATKATTVQQDSGNGTYNCSQYISRLGTPLVNVTLSSRITVTPNNDGTIKWELTPEVDGSQLDIELVSVASNSGKRCNYSYPGLPLGGDKLSTTVEGDTTSKTVTICAISTTPVPVEDPQPPVPFSTAKDGCTADFLQAGTGNFDIAIGYSKQYEGTAYEGAAICAGMGQQQCVNECVPRVYSEDDTTCKPDAFGRISLACAQCEWDAPNETNPDSPLYDTDMKYCSYYENRVCDGTVIPTPDYCYNNDGSPVTPNTFKPSPKKKSLSANIDVTTGSNCYTVTVGPMYGGRTYSYWYCPTQ